MKGWRIGRIMGIDIAIDASWLLIVALMIYTFGFVEFPRQLHPRGFFPRADWLSITLGVVTTLLLFASVLAHELAHSWMALARGIPVTRITLFIFGGVAQIADEPDRPSVEFWVAILGPLMSLVLAILFGGVWVWLMVIDRANLIGTSFTPLILPASILAQANGSLVLFNLAPGFPLDGGRVLRALLWGAWHDIRRATLWASRIGQGIAVLMIGGGGVLFFVFSNGGGIWYVLIGFFLWTAAGQGYRQTLVLDSLRRVTVDQLMFRNYSSVPAETLIGEFVQTHLLPVRDQTFAVMQGEEFCGSLTLDHIKRIPREEWNVRRVRDVMTPNERVIALAPRATAAKAMAQLNTADVDELPVLDSGRLVGFLGRAELSRYLQLNPTEK
jgi:Zn-dependent protease